MCYYRSIFYILLLGFGVGGQKLGVKTFLSKLTTSRDRSVKNTETRQGWKYRNITYYKNCGTKRLEENSTSVA